MWTRNLTKMPAFTHEDLEEHLVTSGTSIDNRPKGATKHKKLGYQLFKSGYVNGITVKDNVKAGEESLFVIRGKVKQETLLIYTANAQRVKEVAVNMWQLYCFSFLITESLNCQRSL